MEKMPSVGDDVYVPTVGEGEYFVGGLARVTGIVEGYLIVEEQGACWRWKNGLDEMQDDLKKQFGNQRAYRTGIIPPCPLQ